MSQSLIADSARKRMARAVELVEASLTGLLPFDPAKTYTPKELEPYDALSDRFVRATEASLKFYRSYERAMFAENSDTLRDLLSRMHKLSSSTWPSAGTSPQLPTTTHVPRSYFSG